MATLSQTVGQSLIISLIGMNAYAQTTQPGSAAPLGVSNPRPQMSEDPKMKAEGARLAALMEKLQKEPDAEARRKIMSEITCPQ
jgi:hypothetical protein